MVIADRYELGEVIGEGGMGSVFRAVDRKTGRVVAVKLMRPHLADDEAAARRFEREMHAMMLLEHPNTVRLYDSGRTDDDELYLVMELVDGRSLADEIDALGPLPIERVIRIGQHIARALAAVHAKGVVHRDLKPQNIMLRDLHGEPDWVVVLDFGIATLTSASRVTDTGLVAGSALYVSPEQATGAMPGPAGDLYMLGVVLFEMLAGRLPFEASSPHGYLFAHVHHPPASLAKLRPDAPRWLVDLVEELLRKAPEARPDDAGAVLARLTARGERGRLERKRPHPFVDTNLLGADGGLVGRTTTTTTGARRRWLVPLFALAVAVALAIVVATMRASSGLDGEPTARAAAPDASAVAPLPAAAASEDVSLSTSGPDVLAAAEALETPEAMETLEATETREAPDATAATEAAPAPDAGPPPAEPAPPPSRSKVALTSEPSGATVIAAGRSLTTPATLGCDKGRTLTLRFEKAQHLPATRTVTCGRDTRLHVVLQEP